MKASTFTASQIAFALKQARDDLALADLVLADLVLDRVMLQGVVTKQL